MKLTRGTYYMNQRISRYFRDQLRTARASILSDSEAYEKVVLVLERMGKVLFPAGNGLGDFWPALEEVAHKSPLAKDLPQTWPQYHATFGSLFDLVRDGRNTAVHEGALARHLTTHALELALILEDALMNNSNTVDEYMVRDVATAELWQPISFVRQTMLANSFSCLPVSVRNRRGQKWYIVSDKDVVAYLRSATTQKERKARLAKQLKEAVAEKNLKLSPANCISPGTLIRELIDDREEVPVLVVNGTSMELLGILTPFDLL